MERLHNAAGLLSRFFAVGRARKEADARRRWARTHRYGSKYLPHQGPRECERRRLQMAKAAARQAERAFGPAWARRDG